jgi:hypothetical protein
VYKPGELLISPRCDPVKVAAYECYEDGHIYHPCDDGVPQQGVAFLPHLCGPWVIGGRAEALAFITDLTRALAELSEALAFITDLTRALAELSD